MRSASLHCLGVASLPWLDLRGANSSSLSTSYTTNLRGGRRRLYKGRITHFSTLETNRKQSKINFSSLIPLGTLGWTRLAVEGSQVGIFFLRVQGCRGEEVQRCRGAEVQR